MTNIFKEASKKGLRFESAKGMLTVEDLWNLPLTSTAKTNRTDLDIVAQTLSRKIRENTEDSFVTEVPKTGNARDKLALEIVKEIIADKIAERKAKENELANAQVRNQIKEALANKQSEKLANLSEDQLLTALKEVS